MTSLESIFDVARITKQLVADVKRNSIVRYKGDWGVLIADYFLDRWIGGPLKLKPTDVVEVMPPVERVRSRDGSRREARGPQGGERPPAGSDDLRDVGRRAQGALPGPLSDGCRPPKPAGSWARPAAGSRGGGPREPRTTTASFAEAYDEVMAPDGPYREAWVSKARDSLLRAAEAGNVRAIEKILMAYDPEFAFLKPAQFTGDFNVDKLMVVLGDVPTPILQQVRQALSEQRALPDVEA